MPILLFKNISEKHKSGIVEKLITYSTPSQDFFLRNVFAVFMATLGLLLNNVAVIIGSMLISPILYSFLSFSLGLSMSDLRLISRSLLAILKSFFIGIATAAITTLLFSGLDGELTSEILSRANPSVAYASIAFIAGCAAAFSLSKPQLNETLPGIAIAIALIPPIAVVGISIATLNLAIFRGSLLLFLLNTIAIISGSIIVFSLINFDFKKPLAIQIIKKEERKIEKASEEAKKDNK